MDECDIIVKLVCNLDDWPWGIYIFLYVNLYYRESVALKGGQFCLNIDGNCQDKAVDGEESQIIPVLKIYVNDVDVYSKIPEKISQHFREKYWHDNIYILVDARRSGRRQ